MLEFFCLTPLPGSEDHKVLCAKGAWMDPDMNKYDLEHVVADHPVMTREVWHQVYRGAWDMYYTPATCARSCAAPPPPAWECTGWRRFCSSFPVTSLSRMCIRCKAASSD